MEANRNNKMNQDMQIAKHKAAIKNMKTESEEQVDEMRS